MVLYLFSRIVLSNGIRGAVPDGNNALDAVPVEPLDGLRTVRGSQEVRDTDPLAATAEETERNEAPPEDDGEGRE